MRILSFAFVISIAAFVVGCGGDEPTPASCPPGAESASTAHCALGVDTTCRSSLGYDCRCLCTGYWECDQVLAICDAGIPDLAVRDLSHAGD